MAFGRRKVIEARLERYRLIEQRLVMESDSDHELKGLRRVIADLEQQLVELNGK